MTTIQAPKTITLDAADVKTIRAILMTHSAMQDQRVVDTMSIIGRLHFDSPESDTSDLDVMVTTFEDDSDNLKRIALLFEE